MPQQTKRITKPYKTVTGWMEFTDYNKNANGRPLSLIAIGEHREGLNIDYIQEEIYSDILEDIKNNVGSYQISVKLGNRPQLVISMNGSLIIHNPDVKETAGRLNELLERVSEDLIIDAYYEMRLNMEAKCKLSNTTFALASIINSAESTQYPVPFIQRAIVAKIESRYYSIKDSAVKEYVRSMDYTDLIAIMSDIHRYKALDKMNDKYLSELLLQGNLTVKDIENIVGKELMYRLYIGTLTERK